MLSFKKAVSLVIFTCFVFPSLAVAEEEIEAKIGINIIKDGKKDSGRSAGTRPMNNTLSSNESLMVHVTPETDDAFVYIVNSNKNGAELLTSNDQMATKAQTRLFPMADRSYKPDGNNEEFITVIISSREQPKIKTLFASGSVSHEKWKQVEEDLLTNRPELTTSKPAGRMGIGGAVRGLGDNTPTSYGVGWIVKRYQFHVKN